MGQTIGRAPLLPEAAHFLNLPKAQIYQIWEAFNDVAEGFGLPLDEFIEIVCVALKDYLGFSDKKLHSCSNKLFTLLDDDNNDLIDALESLSALALLSGMTAEEKITFIFKIYDFDESLELTIDEMTLALKSCMSGLTKLSGIDPPQETELEQIALEAFDNFDPRNPNSGTIPKIDFLAYCLKTPEVTSWMDFYSDIPEVVDWRNHSETSDAVVADDGQPPYRNELYMASMDCDYGCGEKLAIEERGPKENFVPQEPWQGTVAFTEPTKLPREIPSSAPDCNLELEWIHGFNSQGTRGNVFYTNTGEVVYPAAGVGVVYNANKHSQRFNITHTDKITALAAHTPQGGRTIVATGQTGLQPKINVWETLTMEVIVTLSGLHKMGVSNLDFSPNGELLASIGMDENHCVVVYNWRQQEAVFSCQTTTLKVLDCRWLTNERFTTCGHNHVHFWTATGNSYHRDRGLFGKKATIQPLLTVAAVGDVVVTGALSGHLYVWEGRNCIRSTKAHTGAVTAMYVVDAKQGGLVTGSSDGKIQLWSKNLELGSTFDIKILGAVDRMVQSLCWDITNSKILVGTRGSEIYEINAVEGYNIHDHDGPLVQGHCKNELWGLSMNPEHPDEFCTCGDDMTTRVWSVETRRMVKMVQLDTMARCCTYTPEGDMIIVGLGADEAHPQRKDGAFVVLNEEDLTTLHEARDSKKPLADVKFSPDASSFATGSKDGSLYIYNTADFASKGKCRGHTGQITHFDFSDHGQNIQSNCSNGELLFWDGETSEQLVPRAMQDVKWETQSCVLGWPVQGTWGPLADGNQVMASARSNSGETLCVSDEFGRVRLYRYPCIAANADFREYRGHSAHVVNAAFSADDACVVTLGGADGCIFVWRHEIDDEEDQVPAADFEPDADDQVDYADGADLDTTQLQEEADNEDMNAVFVMEEQANDDDFMPVKPWQRTIVAPSRTDEDDLTEPHDDLKLEWVHGMRVTDCRNNIVYTASNEILFHTGKTSVVFNSPENSQRFHRDHTGDIISIAIHPDLPLAATAEVGRVPSILIWDYQTMKTKIRLRGHHRRAISQVVFSRNGKYLATVGHDDCHQMYVYDWANQTVKCCARTSAAKTLALDFAPDGNTIVQCGMGFITFWSMHGHNLLSSAALLDPKGKSEQPFLSIGWVGSSLVVGTGEGKLYLFVGRQLDRAVMAHTGCIYAISSTNEGICSGGKDGNVKIWSTTLQCKITVDISTFGSLNACVRSVHWNNELNKVLVATLGAEMYEFNSLDGLNLNNDTALLQGHYGSEAHGLSLHPKDPQYCTVGDDKTLRIWDLNERKMLKMTTLENMSRACAYSGDGRKIAVGFGSPAKSTGQTGKFDGKWIVMSEEDFVILHEARDSTKWITEMRFSPDGSLLAVGAFDNKIYVYNAEQTGFPLSALITQHNSFIKHIDFSSNSQYMQSNCGAYELNFFEAETGMYIPAASRLKDVKWQSQTCSMGWAVQGVWPGYADGTEITSVDCTINDPHSPIVAVTGDEFGRVRMFRYPCTSSFAAYKKYYGHGRHIAKVRWTNSCSHLLTLGGTDKSIFQWTHNSDDIGIVGNADSKAAEDGEDEDSDVPKEEEEVKMEEDEKVDFTAVKPWLGMVAEPSNPVRTDPSRPDGSIELAYVHGFQAQTTRNCLKYNAKGDIVYPTASVCVVYNKQSHSQIFFDRHAHEVISLAVSPNGHFVASGEICARPRVRIWDAHTCTEITVLPEFHRQGIESIAFSPNSDTCVSVGQDVDHSIAVWRSFNGRWDDAFMQANDKGAVQNVLFAEFTDPSFARGAFQLVSGGINHIKFWELDGRSFKPTRGIFGAVGRIQPMMCGAAVGNRFVTGSVSGHMYVWLGRTLEKIIRAHERMINALHSCPVGLVSGGKDGFVKIWSTALEHVRTYDLHEATVQSLKPSVKSVCAGLDSSGTQITKVLVGTNGSEIYEISRESGNMTLLNEGHCQHELWGVAAHPTDPDIFATAGDDMTIRVWSISLNRMLRKAMVDCMVRCIDWSPDGSRILVGMGGTIGQGRNKKDGVYMVINAQSMEVVYEGRDSRHWIRDCRYSPDGETIALGSNDQKIYLYDSSTFALRAKCEKHSSHVTRFDFTADSAFMQSDDGAFDHLFFNGIDGSHIKLSTQLRDAKWATWTCTFGWPVQGIWPKWGDVEDDDEPPQPTACCRSNNEKLLASGDDAGVLKLHNFPCLSKSADFLERHVHSGDIARTTFNCNDKYVISVGKNDRTIVVWRVNVTEGEGKID